MEINVRDELQNALKTNEKRQNQIGRLIRQTVLQLCRHQKPHHDFLKLTKMSMDITRLHVQLLEKISKLPFPEQPQAKATIEDWEIVRAAIERGDFPRRG